MMDNSFTAHSLQNQVITFIQGCGILDPIKSPLALDLGKEPLDAAIEAAKQEVSGFYGFGTLYYFHDQCS